MLDTLKMLRPLVDDTLQELTLNELALMYQNSHDSRILATVYCKMFKFALSISNKYHTINDCDKASFCLEKLDYCMSTYKPDFEFLTYFGTMYKNALIQQVTNMNFKKRKCILVSINELISCGIEDTYDIIEMFIPSNLTEREYMLCKLESQGYTKRDCAERLGVSKMTISNIEKSLRHKLSSLQN